MTKEEFGRRIAAVQARMYRIARGYLRGEHDCLDAVSEAILKAWQKQATLRDERLFDTWLIRILIRECINIHRGQKRIVPVETPPETEAAEPAGDDTLRDAIDSLPQKQRVAVVLHYMEGYGVAEIAEYRKNIAPYLVFPVVPYMDEYAMAKDYAHGRLDADGLIQELNRAASEALQ